MEILVGILLVLAFRMLIWGGAICIRFDGD